MKRGSFVFRRKLATTMGDIPKISTTSLAISRFFTIITSYGIKEISPSNFKIEPLRFLKVELSFDEVNTI